MKCLPVSAAVDAAMRSPFMREQNVTYKRPSTKFPYAVFYVSEHARTAVLAVLHTSRDPRVWPRRLLT